MSCVRGVAGPVVAPSSPRASVPISQRFHGHSRSVARRQNENQPPPSAFFWELVGSAEPGSATLLERGTATRRLAAIRPRNSRTAPTGREQSYSEFGSGHWSARSFDKPVNGSTGHRADARAGGTKGRDMGGRCSPASQRDPAFSNSLAGVAVSTAYQCHQSTARLDHV